MTAETHHCMLAVSTVGTSYVTMKASFLQIARGWHQLQVVIGASEQFVSDHCMQQTTRPSLASNF
jgi:hypothetical protein